MPKFYVESGLARCVIDAIDAEDAAVKAFQWSCDSRDSVLAPESLGETAVTEADGWELGEEIRVSEQGFGRSDGQVFDTMDIIPVWQGYAFPWC
ncbi:MAG: hypothetical protein NTY19_02285 [Planctomycetota bacterium]|nr:hypothetical protein [Planctomycetota bacterium]